MAPLQVLILLLRHLEAEITRRAKEDDLAKRLMTIPGIGPLIATAFATLAPAAKTFHKGWDFAAWFGLVRRQHSTGGKQRFGATTKMGERSLRRLLIISANSLIIKRNVHAGAKHGTWLGDMLGRKPTMWVAGRTGQQKGADRMGPDGPRGRLPGSSRGGVIRQGRETRDTEEGKE